MIKNKFKSDGCSGVPELIFHDCCVQHDKDYYNKIGRLKADRKFRDNMYREVVKYPCDAKTSIAYLDIADAYYLGVRLFGWIFYYFKRRK